MSDDNQLEIAQSFLALFLKPGSAKLQASREFIAQRYEWCDDMAHMLSATALEKQHTHAQEPVQVLTHIHQALTTAPAESAVVSAQEAAWVVCRLAELCGWTQPVLELEPLPPPRS